MTDDMTTRSDRQDAMCREDRERFEKTGWNQIRIVCRPSGDRIATAEQHMLLLNGEPLGLVEGVKFTLGYGGSLGVAEIAMAGELHLESECEVTFTKPPEEPRQVDCEG